ncbi:restriction endonuclease subunit S [Vibrio parahaemolyticus]|uniref:restriction endonuclease subunit S n=1 Tax=Vibrio parahaemolyticus TaxID=670 RepID=UPI0008139247|nr:restriction endonuclease subunit S [Vibrio parahaemolyticus]EGQ9457288.1 restriction endonuclease subunit S [Vibrio parahaemolyticus]EJE4689112.1 restriction endonuclease subunit S [Vibrio parahaemolyticus]EJK2425112.1 restriction endonuclease subunit S [Vibrio parahaemolyticus]OCP67039.1 hypothetical protein AKH08_21000 [Vibrio parahaemolyticus]
MSWPLVKLGEVAPSKALKNPVVLSDDNVWQLNLDMVESNSGRIINKLKAPLSEAGSSTHWFDERHVLYSKLRPYLNKVVLPDEQGLATTELVPMLPDPEKLDRRYLVHYLRSKQFVSWISDQVAGAKMPRVSMKIFWDHEIPLPPLAEQKRIAAILDKADAIRQKRKQAIDLADEFLRSVFLDMFGDPVTNPKGWEVEKFGNVGSLDRGKSKHRPRNDPKLLGGLHPLVQTGDVANSKGYLRSYTSTYSDFGLAQSKKWPAGTLCITIAANIAKTGILTFDACFPDSVVGFTPNSKTTTEYVQAWISFLQKILEANAPESAQKNINLAILRDLDIPVPPVSQQKKFTMIVENVNSVLNRTRASKESKEQLFNSLSQKAFSGQL